MKLNKLSNLYFLFYIFVLLYLIFTKSITGDETGTVWIANHLSFLDILKEKYIGDYNPFGFFLLNKAIITIINNPIIYKIIPVVFMLGSIYLVYKIIVDIFNDKDFAILNSITFSLFPMSLYYAVFDRAYSLLLLFSLLIFYLSLKIFENPTKNYKFLYVLTITIGLYFHYFVGLYVAILFFVGLFFEKIRKNKKFILTIFGLNVLALLLFVPELLSFLQKAKDVAGIEQQHAKLGYILKAAFVAYGLILSSTLAPINKIIIILIGIVFLILVIEFIQKRQIFKDKYILFSLLFILVSLAIISFTGFARSMYIIFATPFLAFILTRLFYKYQFRISIVGFLILFLFSNYNFIFNKDKFFVSPQESIDYKYYYSNFLKDKVEKDTLVIVSPSFNRANFEIYSNYPLKKVYLINPFIDVKNQLNFDKTKYKKIIVYQEFQNQDIFPYLDNYLKNFNKKKLVNKKHKSFIKKREYSFFKIVEYKK